MNNQYQYKQMQKNPKDKEKALKAGQKTKKQLFNSMII